jgi:hypothetical protein
LSAKAGQSEISISKTYCFSLPFYTVAKLHKNPDISASSAEKSAFLHFITTVFNIFQYFCNPERIIPNYE